MAAVPVYLSILFAIALANVIVQGDGSDNGTQPEIAVVTAPHHVTVEKKSPLLLNCSVVTSPDFGPLQFVWYKDGQPLTSQLADRRVHVFQNGSLYFRRIVHRKRRENRLSDEGLYECVAGNKKKGSVVARRVHVQVAAIARNFTKEPVSVTTYVGGAARFDCSIKATPPATIVWQRDNIQLTVDDSRFVQLPSGALQIHNVLYSDQGSYRCMATQNFNHLPDEVTNIKWKWSQQARLKVLDHPGGLLGEPQMLAIPNNTTAMAEETVILECLANGEPPPKIKWIRKDNKLLSDRHRRYGGVNLLIDNVQLEDEGVYQCVVNSGHSKQGDYDATLSVQAYPVMVTDPESNEWPITRTVTLLCEVEGNPKPRILWYFNGRPLHSLSKETIKYQVSEDGSRLIVYTIGLENAGYYQCIAENTIGQVFAIARIGVFAHKDAPPPPEEVTLTPVSSSVLRMDWIQQEPPKDRTILAFLIAHRIRDEGSLKEEQKTVGGTKRSHNLTDLRPYTTYVVTIRTFSRKGASAKYIVEGRTLAGVPLAVPALQVSSPSGQTMLVRWDALMLADQGGIITQYQLQHRPSATPSAVTTITLNRPEQRSYLVTGLTPGTKYEVRMAAGTKNGFPVDRGGWSHHTTPKVSSHGAPQLKVDVLNTTAVLLHWERLEITAGEEEGNGDGEGKKDREKEEPHSSLGDGQGQGQRYLIQAVELRLLDRNVLVRKAVLDPPAPTYILNQLENNTDYEVTVFGSQRVVQVTHTFRISEGQLVPSASQLRGHLVSPSTVRLQWTPSFKSGGGSGSRIVKYQVCFNELGSSAQLEDQCLDSERPYAVISDLKPFTKYNFGVRIVTNERYGSFTMLEVVTSEDRPSPPVNLTYDVLKRGSVRLQWSPPSQPNGVITSYVIFYNLDNDMPDSLWTNLTKTGQQRVAEVDGLDMQQYFFKLSACTKAGRGHPSKVVMVYPDCVTNTQCASSINNFPMKQGGLSDKQVGIIIGVFIGIACIIVCIIVILCRHRCFQVNNTNSPDATMLPSHHHHHGNNNVQVCHGNGHVPSSRHGNGHAHGPGGTGVGGDPAPGSVEMTALETMPMLIRLPENEMSDAKGGGDMIVTPNGVRMNGLVKMKINGHLPNGHVPPATLDISATSEERRGLIEAMLAATVGGSHHLNHQNSAPTTTVNTNSTTATTTLTTGDCNDHPNTHHPPPSPPGHDDPEGDSLSGLDLGQRCWDSVKTDDNDDDDEEVEGSAPSSRDLNHAPHPHHPPPPQTMGRKVGREGGGELVQFPSWSTPSTTTSRTRRRARSSGEEKGSAVLSATKEEGEMR